MGIEPTNKEKIMLEQTGLVVPDFSEVTDQLSAGTYSVRIVGSKVDQWAGKDGNPPTTFINWTLETFNESEEKNNGRRLWHKTPVNGKGAFRLQEFYKAAMLTACPATGFDREELLGKELQVTLVDGIDRKSGQPTGYTEVKVCKALTQ